MKTKKINIDIVDDEVLIAELLESHFSNHNSIVVKNVFGSGQSFLKHLKNSKHYPDMVLLDLKMEGINGMEVTTLMKKKYPAIKIIVLSSYYKKTFMGYMLRSGVNAFIPKGVSLEKLTEVIIQVHKNDYFFMKEHIDTMRQQISQKVPQPKLEEFEKFTPRELQVLQLICQQFTATEIATKLYITKRTAEGHRSGLLLKSGAKNTAGLIIWAIQNSVIDLDDFPIGI